MPTDLPKPDLDDAPWYRQFWPWFLIAIPAAAVVAGIVTIIIAVRTAEPVLSNAPHAEPPSLSVTADV